MDSCKKFSECDTSDIQKIREQLKDAIDGLSAPMVLLLQTVFHGLLS